MPNKRHRLILDTNLWISFLITKNYSKLDGVILANNCTLLFSNELMDEFVKVATSTKLKKYFTKEDVANIIETILPYAEMIEVVTTTDLCRDPKDNFLLSLAIDGDADYLLTGDKDLLVLNQIFKTKITTITEFLVKHS